MMKRLQFHILIKKAFATSLRNGIHTDVVLFERSRRMSRGNTPSTILKQPGLRVQRSIFREKIEFQDEIVQEHDLEDDSNFENIDRAHDEDIRERKRFNERVQLKIIAKKFFSPDPQPSMLTHNERLCIRYLHQQDPVQWDFRTLSESFPATPSIIKKIIKVKYEIPPERAKIMDLKVQRNWELLAEGKLNANPHYLEHLKKFVNRRKVLLEQIKNETFYLPKIKKEHVWNQGEMSSILTDYEKSTEKLIQEHSYKALPEETDEVGNKKNQTSLHLTRKQIEMQPQHITKEKNSFMFGETIGGYKSHVTLDELENKILKKSETKKKLEFPEKDILENKFGITTESFKKFNDSPPPTLAQEETRQSLKQKQKVLIKFDKANKLKDKDSMRIQKTESNKGEARMRFKKTEPRESSVALTYDPPDENTHFGSVSNVAEILNELQNKSKPKEELSVNIEDEKKKIDYSDPERLKRENFYYDKEVSHIKNTAFWKNNRSSKDKEMEEYKKPDLEGPCADEDLKRFPKMFVLNPNPYPERIKIPKSQQGSGLTFRIKDCYYDDDGEFLYRVPGMSK